MLQNLECRMVLQPPDGCRRAQNAIASRVKTTWAPASRKRFAATISPARPIKNFRYARAISVREKSSPVNSRGMPATDATAYAMQSPKFKAAG